MVTGAIALAGAAALESLVGDGLGWPPCARAAWCCWRRAPSRASSRRPPSGCWSGGSAVGEHPLWSSFVWRNEVADTFVEMVAAPWFARAAPGDGGARPVAARARGADRAGRLVRDYWLPEADLVSLGDGATVNRGCVVQTHCSMIDHEHGHRRARGRGHARPARRDPARRAIGAAATVGPASLVMRGESVPAGTRWIGNPIGPWPDRSPTGPAGARRGPAGLKRSTPTARERGTVATASQRYDLDLDYRVETNRLAGTARIDA